MAQGDLETIGRFRIERLLGSGGMGAVFLASDPVLKRRVAVKIVRGSGSQQEGLARFQREAEVSAQLNHPNVITIYDVGEDAKSGPFIAMEYVDGSSLGELVEQNALRSAAERLKILVEAMRAIEAAHAANVVHRDIKPGNLMVARDGRVKLMDFGVARNEDSGLTMTGAVIGTPAYISPEQLKGLPPSAATDRYAFFVMAFEVFTAVKPFTGPTTVTVLYNIAHQPPAFPDSMPAPIRAVFERALAKEPSARFQNLRGFLVALVRAAVPERPARERLLSDLGEAPDPEPVVAPSPSSPPGPVVSEGLGGRGLGVLAAGAVAIVAAGAVGYRVLVQPTATAPIVVAQATAVPVATARPTSPPPPPTRVPTQEPRTEATAVPVVPTAVPVVVASVPTAVPTPPAAVPTQRTVASIEPPPVRPTRVPVVRPSPAALRTAVSDAFREQGLQHVDVRLTGERRMMLANLRSTAEAERARSLAARITDGELDIETALREAPRAAPTKRPPRPVSRDEPERDEPRDGGKTTWQIQPEGSERSDP